MQETTPGNNTQMIGQSLVIQEALEAAGRIAKTDTTALITGESGTGKELFAELIHSGSNRADKPFVRVNCAAIPEGLLESELFGHVQGAFTDAKNSRTGRFPSAHTGTILLDEIGEITPVIQAKLLRVLQNKMVEPLGSDRSVEVDVRILASTNKDLFKAVQAGTFREDLYYRLSVLPIVIPPLRARIGDIPELAAYFVNKFNEKNKKQVKGISGSAMELLIDHRWPGNVRELENTIERALIVCKNNFIEAKDIFINTSNYIKFEGEATASLKTAVDVFKKRFIRRRLLTLNGNRTKTAKSLGIQRTYLSRLIKELEIKE